MNIGPKMAFILPVYQMTEAQNAENIEHDLMTLKSGTMTESEFWKRTSTRSIARGLHHRDDAGNLPRNPNLSGGSHGRRRAWKSRPAKRRREGVAMRILERRPARTGALLIPFPPLPTAGNP
jgi:hypothetical protein